MLCTGTSVNRLAEGGAEACGGTKEGLFYQMGVAGSSGAQYGGNTVVRQD